MKTDPHAPGPRPSRRLRAGALVALASLSCTTVRVPASAIPPRVPLRGDVAEPQVELWIESGDEVSRAEAERAAADARAALGAALASRRLSGGEQLLVVREQGVSRTGSRRADQGAAVAGLVVAAVAVVAVVVIVLVASKGEAARGAKAPSHAPAAPRPAPPPVAVRPAPMPPLPPPPVVAPPPAPHGGPVVAFGVDVNVGVPAGPQEPPPTWSDSAVAGPPLQPPPPPAAPEPEPLTGELALAPVRPLEVSRRGFFAGDSTRLELTLVDRKSGAPLWVKTVESKVDPRDARAVRGLLERALDDRSGWLPATPAP